MRLDSNTYRPSSRKLGQYSETVRPQEDNCCSSHIQIWFLVLFSSSASLLHSISYIFHILVHKRKCCATHKSVAIAYLQQPNMYVYSKNYSLYVSSSERNTDIFKLYPMLVFIICLCVYTNPLYKYCIFLNIIYII